MATSHIVPCEHCRLDIDRANALMSADGWLCAPCGKIWERGEEHEQPRPWFHRDKLPLDELPSLSVEGWERAKQKCSLWFLVAGIAIMLAGLLATSILYSWLLDGGVIPAVLGAGPLAVVVGVILSVWSTVDWVRASSPRREP